jgi:hypothetical protein
MTREQTENSNLNGKSFIVGVPIIDQNVSSSDTLAVMPLSS